MKVIKSFEKGGFSRKFPPIYTELKEIELLQKVSFPIYFPIGDNFIQLFIEPDETVKQIIERVLIKVKVDKLRLVNLNKSNKN